MNPRSKRQTVTLALSAAALLAASGCKVGPDYAPPDLSTPVPGTFSSTSAGAPLPPEAAWWRTLNDQRLNSLIDRAVASNLDLKAAAARVREARAQRGVTNADRLPQLDANGSYTRNRISESTQQGRFVGGTRNTYDASIDATWELDIFGAVARAVEASEADIDAAVEARRDTLVTLLSEVARNYSELRGFQRRIVLANQNVEVQSQTLELTRSRFKAGLTNDLDVAQAEAQLATTKAAIPTLTSSSKGAIFRLGVLLGLQPAALADELAAIEPVPAPPIDVPVGLPSELLQRRPDVRRSERLLAAQTARIGVATAELFPRFSLTGDFGFQAENGDRWFNAGSRFWSYGPGVRWPIFQGGRIRSNIKVQEARTEAVLAEYESAVLRSFEDVENALTQYDQEKSRFALLNDAVTANQRAVTLSEQLYKNGVADFQRVLDSQRNLFLAQDSLAESQTIVTTSLIRLYKALGGGWDTFEKEPVAQATGPTPAIPEAQSPPR